MTETYTLGDESPGFRVPVSAFKDEGGYTITFDDGNYEESPVQTLAHLREVARYYGRVLKHVDGEWRFELTRRAAKAKAKAAKKAAE